MNTKHEIENRLSGDALRYHPLVLWLAHRLESVHGGNKSALCRELGTISDKVVSALLDGTYKHDVNGMLARLAEQKERLAGALVAQDVDLWHIPTKLAERVWVACDAAKSAHLVINVCGKSQIGKSTAAEMYKARYPETTILLRMPTRPTVSSLLHELADALRLSGAARKGNAALMRAIRERLGRQHLLIVDEAHLALTRQQGADALDVLRELYDRCGCGLVLIFTDIGSVEFCKGSFAGQVAQLENRGEWEPLPGEPCAADVQAIWRGFGLPDPDAKVQAAIGALCRASCFGKYVHRLRWAAASAQRQGVALTWELFLAATKHMEWRPDCK